MSGLTIDNVSMRFELPNGGAVQALKNVSLVGNDLKISVGGWTCGKNGQRVPVSQGLPTVRIDGSVTVGGVEASPKRRS